jgi:hypothetical protein
MDTVVTQLARELAGAISAAVADDTRVEACRAKARAVGYDLRVSLEARIGFASHAEPGATPAATGASKTVTRPQPEITNGDRRFLKSLRIAADETAEK